MNIKAILVGLVLGSSSIAMSSVAMASPVSFSGQAQATVSYGTTQPAPIVRDHRVIDGGEWVRDHRNLGNDRYEATYTNPSQPSDDCTNVGFDSYYRGPVGRMPASGHANIMLTAPTKIVNGREIITVGADKGGFTQLTLRANSGSTFIQSVELVLGKGDTQVVQVNQWLSNRNSSISFDVDGRRGRLIDEIIVNGQSNFGARYSISSAR